MNLIVTPGDGLVDEVPVIRVSDVNEGGEVSITVEMDDAAAHPWRAEASFAADGEGTVDTSTMSPTIGSWTGVDASGPWWSMDFMDEAVAPTAFTASDDALLATVTATADGQTSRQQVWRRWRAPGVSVDHIEGDGFRSLVFLPDGTGSSPGVLVVPGSTGVSAMAPMAALLASHGFVAAVVGYMEDEGLPASLQEIPIEVIAAAMTALSGHGRCAGANIGIVCASVETEGALSALAHIEGCVSSATVAIAPSHVVWQALSAGGQPPKTASWSMAGQPLAWVHMHGEKLLGQMLRHSLFDRFSRHPKPAALHMRAAFEPALADTDAVAAAAIPVEQIAGPLMVVAGGDDAMWPSVAMANAIATRRRKSGVGDDDAMLVFEHAGHFIRPPVTPTTVPWNDSVVSGGDPAAIAVAQTETWAKTLAFLRTT